MSTVSTDNESNKEIKSPDKIKFVFNDYKEILNSPDISIDAANLICLNLLKRLKYNSDYHTIVRENEEIRAFNHLFEIIDSLKFLIIHLKYKTGEIKSLDNMDNIKNYGNGFLGANEKQTAAFYVLKSLEKEGFLVDE